jgi:hypothetical protein
LTRSCAGRSRPGAARAEQHFAKIPRREVDELARQRDRGPVRVAARAERELLDLSRRGGDHRRVCEPHLMDEIAVEVHVPPALQVLEVDPLAAAQRVEARRRQGLAEEVAGIGIEDGARLGVEHRGLPARAAV